MIENVVQGLGEVKDKLVFVGGAIASLYIDENLSVEIRPTEDVDCIIEIMKQSDYRKLEKDLLSKKFVHDTDKGAPICRWKYLGVKVDIMPTDSSILGFSNKWYEEGIEYKENYKLPSGKEIYILSFPYFIATKLEAFYSRGENEYRFSSDIEDIIITLDGNPKAKKSFTEAPDSVKKYLSNKFENLLGNRDFIEVLEGFLGIGGIERIEHVKNVLKFNEKKT